MRGKGKTVTEIREILRWYRITRSKKETARTLKIAKGTVKRYVRWAEAKGYFVDVELPTEAELAREWCMDDRGRSIRQTTSILIRLFFSNSIRTIFRSFTVNSSNAL